jgi:hypothetical protein
MLAATDQSALGVGLDPATSGFGLLVAGRVLTGVASGAGTVVVPQ